MDSGDASGYNGMTVEEDGEDNKPNIRNTKHKKVNSNKNTENILFYDYQSDEEKTIQ